MRKRGWKRRQVVRRGAVLHRKAFAGRVVYSQWMGRDGRGGFMSISTEDRKSLSAYFRTKHDDDMQSAYFELLAAWCGAKAAIAYGETDVKQIEKLLNTYTPFHQREKAA